MVLRCVGSRYIDRKIYTHNMVSSLFYRYVFLLSLNYSPNGVFLALEHFCQVERQEAGPVLRGIVKCVAEVDPFSCL